MDNIDKPTASPMVNRDMRKRASWMKSRDDLILETLEYTDAALSVSGIEVNTARHTSSVSSSTLYRRLPDLLDGGLIETVGPNDRFYVITDDGRAYLNGEFTPPELDD